MKKETLLSERRTEDAIFGGVNGANIQHCYEKYNRRTKNGKNKHRMPYCHNCQTVLLRLSLP